MKGANTITINQILEVFDAADIYLVYLFVDLYFLIQRIQTAYISVTFNPSYNSEVKSLTKHPINSLLVSTSRVVWRNLFAHYLITNIYIDIGGNIIDQYNNHYYNIHSQLNRYFDSNPYQNMIQQRSDSSFNVYIPLVFWFNRFNSLGLPVIALRYHDVTIGVTINTLDQLVHNNFGRNFFDLVKISKLRLITEYIYLSNAENLKFTTSSIEYLIEQTQVISHKVPPKITSLNIELNFEMPCKELYWVCQITNTKDK
jgi:hypothetical protein